MEVRYIPLAQVRKWNRNPKKHDLGAIAQSITQHGFKDPPKFEPRLNDGQGGLAEGNGRDEVLTAMQRSDPEHPPRGILLDPQGEWLIPVLFGVDASSQQAAEAYAVDHNNLTLMGGDLTLLDIAKIWDLEQYNELLRDLAAQGATMASVDGDDIDTLQAILNGLPFGLDALHTDGGDARTTKITLVFDVSEVVNLEEITAKVRAFIDVNGWKLTVDV